MLSILPRGPRDRTPSSVQDPRKSGTTTRCYLFNFRDVASKSFGDVMARIMAGNGQAIVLASFHLDGLFIGRAR